MAGFTHDRCGRLPLVDSMDPQGDNVFSKQVAGAPMRRAAAASLLRASSVSPMVAGAGGLVVFMGGSGSR